jgi:hypothetical protein
MNGYYITSSGEVVELFGDIIDVSSKNIVKLILPEGCKEVICSCNKLTNLIIPDGCKKVNCF